ncbi:MAG: CoA transferase [Dehalococcoidia bacterium]|nr:CoA transferase [Dehalococcoidia bacterium]
MTGFPPAGRRRPLVIDLTSAWSGPQCTSVLADQGWDVVKVESSTRPDVTRRLGPWANGEPGLERSGYFQTLNRGKRSIAIDLRTPGGKDLARQLCLRADVVVENFSPGVMQRLGLDYASLSPEAPGLIVASISGYGAEGPESAYVAYGQTIEAVAGLDAATGYGGDEPMACGAPIADHVGGMTAASAILAAYYRRETADGRGCHIDLSMVEALLALMPAGPIEYQLDDVVRMPAGNRDSLLAPHGCYPAKGDDAWVAISVTDTAEWRALAEVLGLGATLDLAALDDAASRKAHEDAIDAAIRAATRAIEPGALQEQLRAAGVPATVVLDGNGLRTDETLSARGFFADVTIEGDRPRSITGRQALFSYLPATLPGRAPRLGEHTADVLHEVLGMEADAVAELTRAGVLN